MPRRSELYSWDHISGPHDGGGDGHTCDCRIEGNHRTVMCVAQLTYHHVIDSRWAADYIRANPASTFTPEYLALARPYLGKTGFTNNEDLR